MSYDVEYAKQLEHVVDHLLVAFLHDEPLNFHDKPIPDWVRERLEAHFRLHPERTVRA